VGAPDPASTLASHARRLSATRIADLLAADPARVSDLSMRVGPIHASFARQRYDHEAFASLLALAGEAKLPAAFRALFDGEKVNRSEDRPALHVALRSALGSSDI